MNTSILNKHTLVKLMDRQLNDPTSSQTTSNELLIKRLKTLYSNFNSDCIEQLSELYTQDVEFIDPVHHLQGLLALKRYFRNQTTSLSSCKFRYLSELLGEDKAFIRWEMEFSHPKIANGRTLTLPGVSEIHFSNRIFYQQDFYDLGAMLYEHVPVVGSLISFIKKKLST